MVDSDQKLLKRLLADHASYGQIEKVAVKETEFIEILPPAHTLFKSESDRAAIEGSQNYELIGDYLAINKDQQTAESTNNWHGSIIHFKLTWTSENSGIPYTIFAWAIDKHVPPTTAVGYIPTSEGFTRSTYQTVDRVESPLLPPSVNFASALFKVALPFVTSNILTSVELLDSIISTTQEQAARFTLDEYVENPGDGERSNVRIYDARFNIGREKVKNILSKSARRAGCSAFKAYNSNGIAVAMHPSSPAVALLIKWSPDPASRESTLLSFLLYQIDPYLYSEIAHLPPSRNRGKNFVAPMGSDRLNLDDAYYRATSWAKDFIRFLKFSIEKSANIPEAADQALIKKLMPEHSDYAFLETFPVDEGQFIEILSAAFKSIFNRDKQSITIQADKRSAEATLSIVPISSESKVAKLLLRWLPEERQPFSTQVVWVCYEYWTPDSNKPTKPNKIRYSDQGKKSLHHSVKELLFKAVAGSAGASDSKRSFERTIQDEEALWRLLSSYIEVASTEELRVRVERIPEILRFLSRFERRELIIYEARRIAAFPHPAHTLLLHWQPVPDRDDVTVLCCLNYRVLQGKFGGKDYNVKPFLDDLRELIARLPTSAPENIN